MQRGSSRPISTLDSILSQWHFGDDVRFEHSEAFSVSRNPLYQKCCTLTAALCQYLPLRIFLVALCQYMYLCPSGIVPKYALVALCQSIPIYPSGIVPTYTSIP